MSAPLREERVASPLGAIVLVSHGDALCALDFGDCEARMRRLLEARYGARAAALAPARRASEAARCLRAYLAGELDALADLAVEAGGTTFQRRVWRALRRIPPGQTRSYAELARAVGRPGAARAVGAANARNPVALVLPCHRVVAADGSLSGYAGGVARKRWLLAHEGALPAP